MIFNKSKLIVLSFTVIIAAGITTSAIIGKKQDEQYAINDGTYNQAELAYNQGLFDLAIENITILLKDDPTNEKLNTLAAKAAYDTEQYELAAKHYQAALDRNPHNVEQPIFMLNLATSYFESKNYERAKVIFEHLQQKNYTVKSMSNYQEIVSSYLQKLKEM